MFRKNILHFLFISLLQLSCVDPFELKTDQNNPILTVEGNFSTGKGPHFVKLSYTDRYGSVFDGRITRINDAKVAIRDQDGNVIELTEVIQDSVTFFNSSGSPFWAPDGTIYPPGWTTYWVGRKIGIYETSIESSAVVGKSYSLQIILPNGKVYTSLGQKALPVAPIENLTYLSTKNATLNPLLDAVGVQILSQFTDPPDEPNFYFWKTANPVYPYITTPEDGNPPIDCCKTCYRFDDFKISNLFAISSDANYDGISTLQPTVRIADDGWRFKDKLRVDFQQYSTNEAGYRYLKLVKQQLEIEGSVFDPLPASLRGNIINLDDPSEVTIGYFFVSDVDSKEIYIKRSDLLYKSAPGVFNKSCRDVIGFSNRLNVIPPYDWDFD